MMQKQQLIETQMLVKTQQLTELKNQATHLKRMKPEKSEEIRMKKEKVDEKFTKILAPIEVRKRDLMKKKETLHFKKDIEDENLWTDEKMAIASSQEVENSLKAANLLLKKNKMMQAEISNHEP